MKAQIELSVKLIYETYAKWEVILAVKRRTETTKENRAKLMLLKRTAFSHEAEVRLIYVEHRLGANKPPASPDRPERGIR